MREYSGLELGDSDPEQVTEVRPEWRLSRGGAYLPTAAVRFSRCQEINPELELPESGQENSASNYAPLLMGKADENGFVRTKNRVS